ncbi:hypothetical protein [Yersinia ruckeri]|nr:hypothetical protein [Yersinia ruckeri]UIM90068.1 hypothetical protein LGL87_12410 [Yersinia ruckeri]
MTKYIPFLKAKSNEVLALSELSGDILNKVKPFLIYLEKVKTKVKM